MKLLKTMVVLTLVVGLLLGGVLPAQADTGATSAQPSLSLKPDWGKGRWALGKVEVIRGEVTGVDTDTDEVQVSGETIIVDETTKIRVPTLGKEASLADIEVGMQIVVQAYRAEDDALHARHIVVIPGRPQFRHHVGEVTDYQPEVSITIQPRKGDPVTFEILGELKVLPPGATVEVDAWVTVISCRDPAGDRLIARGVVVHPLRARLGLERVSGTIEEIVGSIITIDTTEVTYDDDTIFVLRGIPDLAVDMGQEAIAFCREQDGTLLAKLVLVGVDLPGIKAELGRLGPPEV